MKDALAALEVRKDAEKTQALEALRAELNEVVQNAIAEKKEYLALYTKVRDLTLRS